jgi:hypothetical protein
MLDGLVHKEQGNHVKRKLIKWNLKNEKKEEARMGVSIT